MAGGLRVHDQYCRNCGHKFRAKENGYCEICRCIKCDRRAVYKVQQLCRTHYSNYMYHTSPERNRKQKEWTRNYLATHRSPKEKKNV